MCIVFYRILGKSWVTAIKLLLKPLNLCVIRFDENIKIKFWLMSLTRISKIYIFDCPGQINRFQILNCQIISATIC